MFEHLARRLRAYAEKDGRGYPDWALRYVPIVRRLERHGVTSKTLLEIGANANGVARFLKQHPACIISLDMSLDSLREARAAQQILPVMADAAALPFRDKDVDVCVCIDTLEHLPQEKRRDACMEIVRVLAESGWGVVAFPCGAHAIEAERRMQEAYHQYTDSVIYWLKEHADMGLPDAEEAVRTLTEASRGAFRITLEKNTPVIVWNWIWRVLMCGWPGRGNAVFQALLRLLTPLLCRMHFGRCYRVIVWIEPTLPPRRTRSFIHSSS